MFSPLSRRLPSPAGHRPLPASADAWRKLLGAGDPAPLAEPRDAWACSSFHASSWDLRHGLEIEEYEWVEAELPAHLEGALHFA